jgi:hypothetical protein
VTVRKERSNQLNYVPNLFSYLYRKPASLVAFLRFNRFACVACFNPVEPNSEVNGHHGHQAKRRPKPCCRQRQPRAAVPAPLMNCSRGNSDRYRSRKRAPNLNTIYVFDTHASAMLTTTARVVDLIPKSTDLQMYDQITASKLFCDSSLPRK